MTASSNTADQSSAIAESRPVLFLLHALGGSARSWDAVVAGLGSRFECVALDIPGFGGRADAGGLGVGEMADWLTGEIAARSPASWMIAGNSMGGKLGTIVVSRAEAGFAGVTPARGVVLVAASPPAPEPMDEERRAAMIGWWKDGRISKADARRFVEANIAAPLPDERMRAAVSDVERTSREAWIAWLEGGSREDWSAAVGQLATPALVVAGAEDGDLGAANQRRLNLPHYRDARLEIVEGAAHLIPAERPDVLAALIAEHWERSGGA